ncbi:MAG TPA: pyridoxamine 5'-phosphate oxidase family protein [Verrucomicrobiota bacterium]|nr:pyridoxamine 5'-phosphate oxidase family protein [Verrucomicrobiota bacterium]
MFSTRLGHRRGGNLRQAPRETKFSHGSLLAFERPSFTVDSAKRMNGDELEAVIDQIWDGLLKASSQAEHPWRLPVLGTQGLDGPSVRTMVLRSVDLAARQLITQTDVRSVKLTDFRKDPRVTWLFFDPQTKVQVRAGGRVTVHHDNEFTRASWTAAPGGNKRNYATSLAPGSGSLEQEQAGDAAAAYANFAVLCSEITFIDWLQLGVDHHRRAQFTWTGSDWRGVWVAP